MSNLILVLLINLNWMLAIAYPETAGFNVGAIITLTICAIANGFELGRRARRA